MFDSPAKKYRVLALSQGYVTIVDTRLYRTLNRYQWHVHFSRGKDRVEGHPYARGYVKGKKVYLHRFIAELEQGKKPNVTTHVDHRNHCTLDNRWENLAVVDASENMTRRRKWGKRNAS